MGFFGRPKMKVKGGWLKRRGALSPTGSAAAGSGGVEGEGDEASANRRAPHDIILDVNPSNTNQTTPNSNSSKEEDKAPPTPFLTLFRFSTPLERALNILALLAAAAAGTAQPLLTLLFGNLAQTFVTFGAAIQQGLADPGSDDQQVILEAGRKLRHDAGRYSVILVLIALGLFLTTWSYIYIWTYTGELNAKRIRENYLRAVLRQEVAFFDKVGAGEVATRIQGDTNIVQEGTSEKVPLAVQFLSSFVTGFVLAYIRSWRLALALSSIFPSFILTGALLAKFSAKWITLSLAHVAEGGSVAEEVISSVRTAHAFGFRSKEVLGGLYEEKVNKAEKVDLKLAMVQGIGIGVFFFTIYAAYALSFSFGTTLILQGRADAGVVVTVFMALAIGAVSFVVLGPLGQAILKATGAASKLFATIDRIPSIDSAKEDGENLPGDGLRGEIEFKDVGFSYPSRPGVDILNSFSLIFEAGKTTALVGSSGSGKSTIISLIERFYDPTSGAVLLDGRDLKELNLRWWRGLIGLVEQEPVLFSTTVGENVSFGLIGKGREFGGDGNGNGEEEIGEEEKKRLVREACVKANADEFIGRLPDGYDTLVGEGGVLLSGGQKQRIAIARAIISNPLILLLDEATSALDTQSEAIVQDALEKAAEGRTTIVVAHRLSTVRKADVIYVLGKGEIIEKGTHEELERKGGVYRDLVEAQKLRGRNLKEEGVVDLQTEEGVNVPSEDIHPSSLEKGKEVSDSTGEKQTPPSRPTDSKKARSILEAEKQHSFLYLAWRMAILSRSSRPLYICGLIAAILTGAEYPAFGFVYGHAIAAFQNTGQDTASRHKLRVDGDRNALWFFLISLAASVAYGVQNWVFGRTGTTLGNVLRKRGFGSALRQDVAFFDDERHNTGALTACLSDNAQKVSSLAGITLGTILQSFSTIITGIIIGFIAGPKVAAVGLACIPLVLSTGYIRLLLVLPNERAKKLAHEQTAQVACESAGAIRTVASLTRETDCVKRYSEALEGPLKRTRKTGLWSAGLFAATQAVGFGAIALVFWYGAGLVSTLEYNVGQFFVALLTVTFGAIQAGTLFVFVPDLSAAQAAANDFINLIDTQPSIDADSPEGIIPKEVQGSVELSDVFFHYPSRKEAPVLRGMNIVAKPGTYVALVGASGCGKSTVVQLVQRFYDPVGGSVKFDGLDIRKYNLREYRKHLALVSQEPTLYAGTIRFNVLLGATKPEDEITQEELEGACHKANILEFIKSLPDGFETEVGGKGAQLSGGQKQRIAIARALIRNPKVLLLDEATSALDSQAEKTVQEALDQAARGRTTLAIAQRLSTIQNADLIYFLKDGRVFESGTHDELMAKKGPYYEYTQLQQLSKES